MSEMVKNGVAALREAWDREVDRSTGNLPPIDFTEAEAAMLVRSVIGSMREPTDAMCDAPVRQQASSAQEGWRAMIDEALR